MKCPSNELHFDPFGEAIMLLDSAALAIYSAEPNRAIELLEDAKTRINAIQSWVKETQRKTNGTKFGRVYVNKGDSHAVEKRKE